MPTKNTLKKAGKSSGKLCHQYPCDIRKKRNVVKQKCQQCGDEYCNACADHYAYECGICPPPGLIPIKQKKP